MPRKSQKKSNKGGGGGRKAIAEDDSPIIELRLEYVAKLMADFCGREAIISKFKEKAKSGEKAFDICDRQIDRYIAEVRKRWRNSQDGTQIEDKKAEIIETLRCIARRASNKISYTQMGDPYDNPDFWVMMQIVVHIAKIEGIYEPVASEDKDLALVRKQIMEDITNERNDSVAEGSL